MKNFIQLTSYLRRYWKYILVNIFLNFLSTIFSLISLSMIIPFLGLLFGTQPLVTVAPPWSLNLSAIYQNFNLMISKLIIANGKASALLFICILVVVLFLLKNLSSYLSRYFLAPVRSGVVRDIRNQIYDKSLFLPLSYYSDERKGDLMARMTTDVQEVEWSVMSSLEMLFRDPIMISGYLITLFLMSPTLTLSVLIFLPVTGYIIGWVSKSLKRTSLKGQQKMGELMSIVEETLFGLRIIRAFNAEETSSRKFHHLNNSHRQLIMKMERKRELASPMSEFLAILVLMAVLWYGGKLVLDTKGLIPEAFIAYIVIFSQIIPSAKSFASAFYNIQRGIASFDRISEVFKTRITIQEKPNAKSIHHFAKEIEFKDVYFSYDAENTLNNINLIIKKGKTVALVGESGGGKTTLTYLLTRFYDPTEGSILIDGTAIQEFRLADLRELMGVVTQDSILFNDTIYNNIALGQEGAELSKVEDAAKIANAHDFILEFPDGYDTQIGDMGSKLSGGQKQRLTIARAVLANPHVLIFDEATSALDSESERLVQEAIYNLMKNRTSIIIAHRLSTIQYVDEILVISKGEIVERGNHFALLAKNGEYKKLHDLQAFV